MPVNNTSLELHSLRDLMEKYQVGDLTLLLGGLISANRDLGIAAELGKRVSDARPGYFRQLAHALRGVRAVCANLECDESLLLQLEELAGSLEYMNDEHVKEPNVQAKLSLVLSGIQHNINSQSFLFLPSHLVHYYDNPSLFGDDFAAAFPTAVSDMKQAGTCYAARLSTACVFHCMRVAEYGLRGLARKVGAKRLIDKGKPCPIDYGRDKVIQVIRGKIAAARQRPSGPAKQARLDYYSNAADHCEYMKDIWRNEVSHTRREYTQSEAFSVMVRVRDFMQFMSKSQMPR